MDYETAVTNLEKLIEWSRTNSVDLTRNEAATRFHLIDHILSDCLGWPPEQIEPERYQNGDYSDYELGLPAKKLVLEAKREGIYFELPLGFNKNKCKIQTLFEDNKDIQAAIKQAVAYCQSRGIPFGAVSNGHQFIAFISNRQDGIPPEEGLAIVFDSLDSI
jgi:predicted type IV restriction endonuclease